MIITFSVVWLCVAVLTMLSGDTVEMFGSTDEASFSVSVLETHWLKGKVLQELETGLSKISIRLARIMSEKQVLMFYDLKTRHCVNTVQL